MLQAIHRSFSQLAFRGRPSIGSTTLPVVLHRHGHHYTSVLRSRGSVSNFASSSRCCKADGTGRESQLSESVRHLMRSVPHPVAVVTSTDTASGNTDKHVSHSWRGATVSSFNTVTLSPLPVISFNIKSQSATFTAIESSGLFNVHLLTHVVESQAIAARFASGNALNPFHDDRQIIESFVRQEDNRIEVLAQAGDAYPPIIQAPITTEEAVTAFRLHCHYLREKTVPIGDHVVVFGEVVETEKASQSTSSLVYVDQRYGKVS
jgi:flavin reductase (DIM6/NTAB) family NADH-FMN oxidoreductase RutF